MSDMEPITEAYYSEEYKDPPVFIVITRAKIQALWEQHKALFVDAYPPIEYIALNFCPPHQLFTEEKAPFSLGEEWDQTVTKIYSDGMITVLYEGPHSGDSLEICVREAAP